jgi:hypothetical protein
MNFYEYKRSSINGCEMGMQNVYHEVVMVLDPFCPLGGEYTEAAPA